MVMHADGLPELVVSYLSATLVDCAGGFQVLLICSEVEWVSKVRYVVSVISFVQPSCGQCSYARVLYHSVLASSPLCVLLFRFVPSEVLSYPTLNA